MGTVAKKNCLLLSVEIESDKVLTSQPLMLSTLQSVNVNIFWEKCMYDSCIFFRRFRLYGELNNDSIVGIIISILAFIVVYS